MLQTGGIAGLDDSSEKTGTCLTCLCVMFFLSDVCSHSIKTLPTNSHLQCMLKPAVSNHKTSHFRVLGMVVLETSRGGQ